MTVREDRCVISGSVCERDGGCVYAPCISQCVKVASASAGIRIHTIHGLHTPETAVQEQPGNTHTHESEEEQNTHSREGHTARPADT